MWSYGISNFLFPLPIPYALRPLQVSWIILILCLVEGPKPSEESGLLLIQSVLECYSFPLTFITSDGILKVAPGDLHSRPSLPCSLCARSLAAVLTLSESKRRHSLMTKVTRALKSRNKAGKRYRNNSGTKWNAPFEWALATWERQKGRNPWCAGWSLSLLSLFLSPLSLSRYFSLCLSPTGLISV